MRPWWDEILCLEVLIMLLQWIEKRVAAKVNVRSQTSGHGWPEIARLKSNLILDECCMFENSGRSHLLGEHPESVNLFQEETRQHKQQEVVSYGGHLVFDCS